MSYANAASSSGPTGHPDPLPKPQEVKTTGKPHGNVETVAEDKFNQIKKKVNEAKPTDAQVEDFKKEVHDAEERGKNFVVELWNRVVASVTKTADQVNKDAYVTRAKYELQNPVVVAQVLAGIGGAVAGYIGYLERHRIRSENRLVVATHGAIITGLVALDVVLFRTYYPQYRK